MIRHFLTLLTFLSVSIVLSQDLVSGFENSVNGQVKDVVLDEANNVLYLGGNFSRIGFQPAYGALLDLVDGLPNENFPRINGTVFASCSDGSGGFYIGGDFTKVGNLDRDRIAHINAAGEVTNWDPSADNTVNTLVLDGSTLYVGGYFSSIGGQSRGLIAALNTSDGLATSWNPSGTGTFVEEIMLDGASVYAVGSFTSMGGQTRNYLAEINKSDGLATTWNPNPSNITYAIEQDASNVYIGGTFISVGGETRPFIAALDKSTGNATSWNAASNFYVYSLFVDGSSLFVGGEFSNIGGANRDYLAELDISTATATAWDAQSAGIVYDIAANASTIYVAGEFNSIGGENRKEVAALDRATGDATSWDPGAGFTMRTLTLGVDNIYVGGEFQFIGGIERNGLAAIDLSDGSITSWNPSPVGFIESMALDDGLLYVVGNFGLIGGEARNRIAALSTVTGLATSWYPITGVNNGLSEILVDGDFVYIAGLFSGVGGEGRLGIAALNKSDGAVVTSWNANSDGLVYDIEIVGTSIYVGGDFTSIGGESRNGIAELNLADASATSWNPSANSRVNAVKVVGDFVYIGGQFASMGGFTRPYFAEVNKSDGSLTATDFSVNNTVTTIGTDENLLLVSGDFTSFGGEIRNYIAGVKLEDKSLLDWNPTVNFPPVNAFVTDDTNVYLGGGFTAVNEDPRVGLGVVTKPDVVAPTFISVTTIDVEENTSGVVYTISADETSTFALGAAKDEGQFTLANDNEVSFMSAPDFENPGDANLDNEYLIDITATDAGGNSATIEVAITVTNVDDTAPTITSATTTDFEENSTAVAYMATADEAVTFSLGVSKDESLFSLANDDEIGFVSAPDFESPQDGDGNNSYVIDVIATDLADNATTLEVTINVTNVDDQAPTITSAATVAVEENTSGVIYTITADESVNYSLGTSKDEAAFAIGNDDEISFSSLPDFENPQDGDTDNEYLIDVIATDLAGNSSTLEVAITVTDIDDTAPVLTSTTDVSVEENSTGIVYTITSDESAIFTLGVSKDESLFSLANDDEISFVASPDFENPGDGNGDNLYLIDIVATDTEGNASTTEIAITVTDLDEVAPTITSSTTATVEENSSSFLYTIVADEASVFSLGTEKDESLFELANDDEISFISAPDFENPLDGDGNNEYELDVIATDAAGNAGMLELVITVSDVSENPLGLTSIKSIVVYPNPAIQSFSLSGDLHRINEVRVVSLEGKDIVHFPVSESNKYTIDKLQQGSYLIVVQQGGELKYVGRLIKE